MNVYRTLYQIKGIKRAEFLNIHNSVAWRYISEQHTNLYSRLRVIGGKPG